MSMIVTVTLNAAIDRTLLVPNFQLGQRHRASTSLASAGRQGHQRRPCAEAARHPGRLRRPRRRADRRADRRPADERGAAERLRPHPRRVAHVDGGVDPTSNVYTEINEWGPEVEEHELAILRDKLAYLTRGAEFIVFSGSLPRGVDDDFYIEVIREANRRGVPTDPRRRGRAARRGIEGEPCLVTPNVREAEQLVGHEFGGDDDLVAALDEIAELGARNVMITRRDGCFALFREDRAEIRLQAVAPRARARSRRSARATRCSPASSPRASPGSRSRRRSRAGVATGAASVLEAGAGRFDVREVNRLTSLVDVTASSSRSQRSDSSRRPGPSLATGRLVGAGWYDAAS